MPRPLMQLPFVLRVSKRSSGLDHPGLDVLTTDDPLPAALELTTDQYIIARATLFTDVKHETTDDK
jgi:hypothetical protein